MLVFNATMAKRSRGLLISGHKLAEVRDEKLMTQLELHVATKTGKTEISLGSIKRWEPLAVVSMDFKSIKCLAHAFGMEAGELRARIEVKPSRGLRMAAKPHGPKPPRSGPR